MHTFLVSCKACGSPVDTGVVDLSRTGRRDSPTSARATWVPALEVDRGCDACGLRAKYSLKRSVILSAN
ncbi:MAG TPA: hypothetical protein VNZ52_00085 [Candidatus Thermoplasmatota archaeon]|nr:hypothetical protein [Candidatus Thermoplasmatota archaeon]